jgi:hypothetical protein
MLDPQFVKLLSGYVDDAAQSDYDTLKKTFMQFIELSDDDQLAVLKVYATAVSAASALESASFATASQRALDRVGEYEGIANGPIVKSAK